MTNIIQLINGSTIVLIALVTYVVVWAVKLTKFNNQYLPIVAELIGAVIGLGLSLAQGDVAWTVGLVDGLVAGAVSVGGNELVKMVLAMFQTEGSAK